MGRVRSFSVFMLLVSTVTGCSAPDPLRTAGAPAMEPAGGTYFSDQNVVIGTETTDAAVYYTTDGTDPGGSSAVYAIPVPVRGNGTVMTIKAAASLDGRVFSDIVSHTYMIRSSPPLKLDYHPYTIPATRGTVITVTTSDDGVNNGDCSSINALLASPGPDGISLREAITAGNNTPGLKSILFAQELKNRTIIIGETAQTGLPVLTGGGFLICGDIDGDYLPDITLDGRFGEIYGPCGNAIGIWSDDNIIAGLNFIDFGSAVSFAPPNEYTGSAKTLSDNQIISCIMTTPYVGIGIGPLGGRGAGDIRSISNLTWQNIRIAGNLIDAGKETIFIYAGSGGSKNNLISDVTIEGNHIVSGLGVGVLAGDMNSVYHHVPLPVVYSDDNTIRGVTFLENIIENTLYSGIGICTANDGNEGNSISDLRITRNRIRNVIGGAGIKLNCASGGSPEFRATADNSLSRVTITDNEISGAWVGVIAWTGGLGWGGESSNGISDDTMHDIAISGNSIFNTDRDGILIFNGMVYDRGTSVITHMVLDTIRVLNNYLYSPKYRDGTGILLAGGFSNETSIASDCLVTDALIGLNTIDGFGSGITVRGGKGPLSTRNSVEAALEDNTIRNGADTVVIDNDEGATSNRVTIK